MQAVEIECTSPKQSDGSQKALNGNEMALWGNANKNKKSKDLFPLCCIVYFRFSGLWSYLVHFISCWVFETPRPEKCIVESKKRRVWISSHSLKPKSTTLIVYLLYFRLYIWNYTDNLTRSLYFKKDFWMEIWECYVMMALVNQSTVYYMYNMFKNLGGGEVRKCLKL